MDAHCQGTRGVLHVSSCPIYLSVCLSMAFLMFHQEARLIKVWLTRLSIWSPAVAFWNAERGGGWWRLPKCTALVQVGCVKRRVQQDSRGRRWGARGAERETEVVWRDKTSSDMTCWFGSKHRRYSAEPTREHRSHPPSSSSSPVSFLLSFSSAIPPSLSQPLPTPPHPLPLSPPLSLYAVS